jgi:hypothetical protein
MNRKPQAPLVILATAVLAVNLHAASTINWGNEFNLDGASDLYQSDGTTPLDSTFTFALGAFYNPLDPLWQPTDVNFNEWLANWQPFDTAVYDPDPMLSHFDPAEGVFSQSSVLKDNLTFPEGRQAYLWIYNTQTLQSGTQWALITDDSSDGSSTDNWAFPSAGNQTSLPLNWEVLCSMGNGSHVIFGGYGGPNGNNLGGEYADPSGDFCLQTHTFGPPIPEPSSVLLLAGAFAFALRRRRR